MFMVTYSKAIFVVFVVNCLVAGNSPEPAS